MESLCTPQISTGLSPVRIELITLAISPGLGRMEIVAMLLIPVSTGVNSMSFAPILVTESRSRMYRVPYSSFRSAPINRIVLSGEHISLIVAL